MKKIFIISVVLFISSLSFVNTAKGQADTIMNLCSKHIVPPFISDGQQYKALLNQDEVAEFHSTFYGGSVYRIVGCSGLTEGNLVFRLYDKERNLLFDNSDYENAAYWDFKFTSTIDCIIEAELDSKNQSSGFAILLVGFKK